MYRWFFKLFYLAYSIISIVILYKILSGKVHTREPASDLFSNDTGNSNISESWPFKMELGLINYVCTVPSPNTEVTEEDLIAAWHLPPKTRLSPLMRQIGHCHLAAQEMASKGIEFDTNNCICVSSWPIVVLALVLFGLVYNIYRFLIGFPVDNVKEHNRLAFCHIYIVSFIPFVIWLVEMHLMQYQSSVLDLGLSHTDYGDVYPKSYYSKLVNWNAIAALFWALYFVNAAELIICFSAFFLNKKCGCIDNAVKKAMSWVKPTAKIVISIPGHSIEPNDEIGTELKMIV